MLSCRSSVLIVDDNAHVRTALREFLERSPHMLVRDEAADGVEAIRKAREYRPELILMDFRMPKLNGVEAAALIRKEMPATRIVIFTMFENAIGKTLAKHTGIDLVVSKGEGSEGLVQRLETLLNESNDGPNKNDVCYHIRWITKNAFDWECHPTRESAEESAQRLVQEGENYTIEQYGAA